MADYFQMKRCDTCGRSVAEDYPFALCPQCLFDGAMRSRSESEPVREARQFGLSPRRDFFEKYEILERVAGGGQGEVWKVWDFEFRRCLAMKRMAVQSLSRPAAAYRFLAEAQIASQLEHPGILPIFDVGLDPDGRPFYTTQLVSGITLEIIWDELKSPHRTKWTLNRAVELLLRACEIMSHAHSRGVIHRDLKPANIMVGAFGDVRVVDWGSAHIMASARNEFEDSFVPFDSLAVETDRSRAMEEDPDSPLATASSGQPITLLFTPPEIVAGELAALGPSTDIYALGAMLYQLLTGQPPYRLPGENQPDRDRLKKAILSGPPPPVQALTPRAPRDLAAICQKAMAYVPGGRYATMADLADDLRAGLEIRPVQARNPGPLLALQKWGQRHLAYVLLGGSALLLLAVAFLFMAGFRAQRNAAQQGALVHRAELAARNGDWAQALHFWQAADAAGYPDGIYLGLQQAEAWTILSEPARSLAELLKLAGRKDLGGQRGAVLLRLGEHELFDEATAMDGAQKVREAMAAGLDAADQYFAHGLLADSTPEALDYFHRAIQINSFHHGAHRHSLGLEFLLGRHADLQASLRFFSAIYPHDPSAGFLAAAEMAMQGDLAAAQVQMRSLRDATNTPEWTTVNDSLPTLAAIAGRLDPGAFLTNTSPTPSGLGLDAAVSQTAKLNPIAHESRLASRTPFLPSIQNGLLEGQAALGSLMLPMVGNVDLSVARIKKAWGHHPEALVPVVGGIYLQSRQPTNGPQSLHLLLLEADLFQLGADSPSVLGGLDRTARYLAAKTEFEIWHNQPTNAAAVRASCLANIRQALLCPLTSLAEFKAYSALALELGDDTVARELVLHLEAGQPQELDTLETRTKLELATGNLPIARTLIHQALAASPETSWALVQQDALRKTLARLVELENNQASLRITNNPTKVVK